MNRWASGTSTNKNPKSQGGKVEQNAPAPKWDPFDRFVLKTSLEQQRADNEKAAAAETRSSKATNTKKPLPPNGCQVWPRAARISGVWRHLK